jgi:hypothetical protein
MRYSRNAYLEDNGHGNTDDEQEEGHHKVRQRDAVPGGMVDGRVHTPSIINKDHNLQQEQGEQ